MPRFPLPPERPRRLPRRTVLRRLALSAGGALALPGLIACSRDGGRGRGSGATGGGGGEGKGPLVISNWPLYIDPSREGVPGSVERFERATGIAVRYSEDQNDAAAFFAKIQPELEAGRTLPQDLFVTTYWMAQRLIDLGWLEPLPLAEVPNRRHLNTELRKPSWDPSERFSLPWQSGISGIAYNLEATGRELQDVDDLFDPKLRGRVGFLTEMALPLALRSAPSVPPKALSAAWSRPRPTDRSAPSPATTTRTICFPATSPPAWPGPGMWPSWRSSSRSCALWCPAAAACSGPMSW